MIKSPKNMEREKKCGRCHQLLPFSAFDRYGGQRREKGGLQSYKSICRICEAKRNKIRRHRNKYKLITEYFNGKCHRCGVDITKILLITVEFHHTDPNNWSTIYHKIRTKSYDKILEWAEKDKVIPLCKNCHMYIESSNFKLFEELILQEDIFKKNASEIDKLLNLAIGQNPEVKYLSSDNRIKIKISIKQWLRKRFIIEQMSNGVCTGCGVMNIYNNLPSFQMNHLDPSKKQNEWLNIHNLDSEKIMKVFIKEDCVWVCSNCHKIIHSTFDIYSEDLYKYFFPKTIVKIISSKINQQFLEISNRIYNFKTTNGKFDFKSPLKLEINLGDTWKKYLLRLFYLFQKIGNPFTLDEIVKYIGGSKHTYRPHLKHILQMGFLKVYRKEGLRNRWELTLTGIQEAKNLEKKLKITAKKLKNEI